MHNQIRPCKQTRIFTQFLWNDVPKAILKKLFSNWKEHCNYPNVSL
jgi:hypothetical protein